MKNIESILKTVIDSNDDVWFFVKPDYSIIYFNQKAFDNGKILHNKELQTGDSLLDYARDTKNNTDVRVINNFEKALNGELVREEKLVEYHNTSMWTLAKYIPVYDNDELVGVSIAVSDITRQKQLEQDELRHTQHIQDMLKRREEFSSITSHELKAPISGIKGFIQLLEKRAKDDNLPFYEKFLSKANMQVNKLTQMVNDLLDVARIEAGNFQLDIAEISVNDLIDDCLLILQPILHEVTVQGELNILVNADKARLEQVVCNIIANAMKYSTADCKILIEAFEQDASVHIRISDGGVGIPEEKQKSLFNSFYRTDDSNLNKTGLGLGLYISNQIIQQHNGKIDVESKINSGSKFTIMLPKK